MGPKSALDSCAHTHPCGETGSEDSWLRVARKVQPRPANNSPLIDRCKCYVCLSIMLIKLNDNFDHDYYA